MSRTLAKVLLCFSAAVFIFLVILDGSILADWLRSLTQIFEFISLIGIGSLLKKKLLRSDASLWAVALLVTFMTSVQALVALPLHKVEIRFASATASAHEWEDLDVLLPDQGVTLSFDSSKSSDNEWVFASGERVLKWGEKAAVSSRLSGSEIVDTIPITWSFESLFELFSPRVVKQSRLPGEKALIRITTLPEGAQLKILYSSNTGSPRIDTNSQGSATLHVRAGGRLQIEAEADGYVTQSLDYDVDSAMVIAISLLPKEVSVTIEAFNLSGEDKRSAIIYIDSERSDYRVFEEFHLRANSSYTVFVKGTAEDGDTIVSEPFNLRLSPGADTTVSCTLLPPP